MGEIRRVRAKLHDIPLDIQESLKRQANAYGISPENILAVPISQKRKRWQFWKPKIRWISYVTLAGQREIISNRIVESRIKVAAIEHQHTWEGGKTYSHVHIGGHIPHGHHGSKYGGLKE